MVLLLLLTSTDLVVYFYALFCPAVIESVLLTGALCPYRRWWWVWRGSAWSLFGNLSLRCSAVRRALNSTRSARVSTSNPNMSCHPLVKIFSTHHEMVFLLWRSVSFREISSDYTGLGEKQTFLLIFRCFAELFLCEVFCYAPSVQGQHEPDCDQLLYCVFVLNC